MADDREISKKTWARAADSISKMGYKDGAADGQNIAFQINFDKGYIQGFITGFKIGTKKAESSPLSSFEGNESDPRSINCQICINGGVPI